MGYGKAVLEPLRAPTRELRRMIPDQWGGFAQMYKATFTDGALSVKVKELLAVAIAVGQQCDGCIASHARAAAREGATPEEFAEMLSVALFMMGGPGSIYTPRAWEAFAEAYEEQSGKSD